MSDEDGFLRRWSRRKQEAREARCDEPPEPSPESAGDKLAPQLSAAPEEACDPVSLPPLESLDAASDYTVFLRKGVPKALRLAALRKAWATDPSIAGFRGLAEYDWDFNAPGYGRLRPDDDPKKVVEAMFRHLRVSEEERSETAGQEAEPPAAPPAAVATPAAATAPASPSLEPPAAEPALPVAETSEPMEAAAESSSSTDSLPPAPPRRRHGGAMPS